jgi:hypothetical protein
MPLPARRRFVPCAAARQPGPTNHQPRPTGRRGSQPLRPSHDRIDLSGRSRDGDVLRCCRTASMRGGKRAGSRGLAELWRFRPSRSSAQASRNARVRRDQTAEQTHAARKVMAAARTHIRTLVPPGTVMALPTSPCIAPPLDTCRHDRSAPNSGPTRAPAVLPSRAKCRLVHCSKMLFDRPVGNGRDGVGTVSLRAGLLCAANLVGSPCMDYGIKPDPLSSDRLEW